RGSHPARGVPSNPGDGASYLRAQQTELEVIRATRLRKMGAASAHRAAREPCARPDDHGSPRLRSTIDLNFFRADDEMDHAARIGNEEAVKIFAEIFHFIALRNAVHL